MKFKKNIINILVPQDCISDFNQSITDEDILNDILGFHIIITSKIDKNTECIFTMNSISQILWSIDRKNTINKCIETSENMQICKIDIKTETELFIWSEESKTFTLETVRNIIKIADKLETIFLTNTENDSFEEIFGFRKRYHFDYYRMLLVKHLCSIEADDFIKEMVNKIIENSKLERLNEKNTKLFYYNVFNNLIQENCGIHDIFRDYREKILNHLKLNQTEKMASNIITKRNIIQENQIEKSLEKQREEPDEEDSYEMLPTLTNKIYKKASYKTINSDVFLIIEYNKKETYFKPTHSIIIFNTINGIEPTINSIIETGKSNYEILVYSDNIQYINNLEKLLYKLFLKNQFKIKFILSHRIRKLSEIQKMIILTKFSTSINDYLFFCRSGCIFPKTYIKFIDNKELTDSSKLYIIPRSNMLNRSTGTISLYEVNHNKKYHYFIECLFPVIHKNVFHKINYQSPIIGKIEKFKDFKNFLINNSSISEVEILFSMKTTNDSLHIFEG